MIEGGGIGESLTLEIRDGKTGMIKRTQVVEDGFCFEPVNKDINTLIAKYRIEKFALRGL